MEKTKTYLINVLFLLFHKHESEPTRCAQAVSRAIREAVYTLYPPGKLENGIKYFRLHWTAEFASELVIELQRISEEISNTVLDGRKN